MCPQPAISSRSLRVEPGEDRALATSSSSVCMVDLPVGRPDRGQLLGDVDADRAPGDAAPAADAPRGAELVDPGAELVREPLAVARPGRGPDGAAVDVASSRPRSRSPSCASARPIAVLREYVDVLDRGAEAGRADERAVAAGEAAVGDLGEARVVEVRARAGRAGRRLERAGPSRLGVVGSPCARRVDVGLRRLRAAERRRAPRRRVPSPPRRGSGARRRAARSATRSKPLSARGPVPIETQKHVPPGVAAVDGDEERALAAERRSRARRRRPRGRRGPGSRSRAGRTSARRAARAAGRAAAPPTITGAAPSAAAARQRRTRDGQELPLPRVRADRPSRTRASSSRRSTRYVRGLLMRRPAVRAARRADAISSSTIAPSRTRRADHAIAPRAQRLDEDVEPVGAHQVRVGLWSVELAHVVASCPG